MKYMLACGLRRDDTPKVVNQPQRDDKAEIEAALEKLQTLMTTNEGMIFV